MDANQQMHERRNKICPGPDMSRSPREHGAEDDIILVLLPHTTSRTFPSTQCFSEKNNKVLIFLFWLWYVSSFFFGNCR